MIDDQLPHVVMMVGNDVTADSRVHKTAASLVQAGLRVTIMDFDRKQHEPPDDVAGCPVLRPKVALHATSTPIVSTARLRELVRSVLRGGRYASPAQRRRAALRRKLAERRTGSRIVSLKLRAASEPSANPGTTRRAWNKVRRRAIALMVRGMRAYLRLRRRLHRYRSADPPRRQATPDPYAFASAGDSLSRSDRRRDWRTAVPDAAAIELAFGPVIDRLQPDLIHAHDYLMLPVGAEASRRSRASGRPIPLIYDAHEYVRGLTTLHDDRRRAIAAMEARFIGEAAAVITVSPALAEKLEQDHNLAQAPIVVLNAPARPRSTTTTPSVRERLGLPATSPLLVYSGNVTPARGVHTLVSALEHLPDNVHLALVTAHRVPYLLGLLDDAERSGVRQRIHLAPYVAPNDVPAYLAGADVGVHPMRRYPNGDIALPNKLFEYMHARLPLVVSDCRAQAAFVRELGIGEVFRADDAADLAGSIQRAIQGRETYRQRLTDELLDTYSWDCQEKALLQTYQDVGLLPH